MPSGSRALEAPVMTRQINAEVREGRRTIPSSGHCVPAPRGDQLSVLGMGTHTGVRVYDTTIADMNLRKNRHARAEKTFGTDGGITVHCHIGRKHRMNSHARTVANAAVDVDRDTIAKVGIAVDDRKWADTGPLAHARRGRQHDAICDERRGRDAISP